MNKMKSFIKEVRAHLEGDGAEVIAQKNYRKASSSVNATISSLKAELVDKENTLEDAKETLNSAKYPTKLIEDGRSYLNSIRRAKDEVEAAQAKVDEINESIKFWEEFSKQIDAEV